eukprot:9283474-Alexandrium_andersonii.AAC.1
MNRGMFSLACRVGEALVPGPGRSSEKVGSVSLLSANITNLESAQGFVCQCSEDIVCFQEHSIPPNKQPGMVREMGVQGWKVLLSPVCPQTSRPTGGVGIA